MKTDAANLKNGVGIVVITHGEAARSMVEAAERVVGRLDVATLVVAPTERPGEIEKRIEQTVLALATEQVLFLVDLEGSTPYNLCCRRCGGQSVVLTGMNMPMLFKLATSDRRGGALALAEELRATGMKSIHIRTAGGPGTGGDQSGPISLGGNR